MSIDNNYPYITAILNTHNTSKVNLITRSLESILAQEVNVPWEVIVVNDGPVSKEVADIVEPFAAKFAEKGIEFNFFGCGEAASGYQCRPKNWAIYHARGEYISFLDYDNEWSPDHLQTLYDAHLEGDAWPDFTYGRRKYIIDNTCGAKVTLPGGQEIELGERDSPFIPWEEKYVQVLFENALNNFIDTSDFMASRGAFWRLQMATGSMWNESYRRFGDWELIARAAAFSG